MDIINDPEAKEIVLICGEDRLRAYKRVRRRFKCTIAETSHAINHIHAKLVSKDDAFEYITVKEHLRRVRKNRKRY